MARRQFRPAPVVVLVLLLVSWSHITTLAQQEPASPATGSFQLTDETGAPLAEIAVTTVADPFQGVAEGYEASPEGRLVAVTATVTNSGSAAFEVRPDSFGAQDADGYLWRQTSVQLPENPVIPVMTQVQIAPGDRITGLLVFELPAQAALATLVYQPESSRVLPVASLGQTDAPAPEIGTQVRIADAEAGTEAVVTVVEWQDPFEDVAEGGEPEAGSRYLLATIAVENVGTAPLDVSSSDFLLRDSQGYLWSTTSVQRAEDVVVPDMQSQTLAPGNRITGAIGFQLETSAQAADVLYQPVSGRLITLAGFAAGG